MNDNHDGLGILDLQKLRVRFDYKNPMAAHVCVAGCFNNWCPVSHALHSSGEGHWWGETALIPGTYEYCLVVDGQWMVDPMARESVLNPFGGRNSVLRVARSIEAAHLVDAQHLPLKNENDSRLARRSNASTPTVGRWMTRADHR